jgi:peptide-methionine (S)-S-oxide reductase
MIAQMRVRPVRGFRLAAGTLLLALVLAVPAVVRAEGAGGAAADGLAVAVFAGGCFWCMEPPFDGLEGVVSTTSGYIGGHVANPRYEQVSRGGTGHAEAVKVVYRPDRIEYEALLEVFWRNIDPLDDGGQFCDRGDQYRSAIFYSDDEQRQIAEQSKDGLKQSQRFTEPIVTAVVPATEFYPAEDYHQDYYQKNPLRYKFYRYGCGRDARLQELWGSDFAGR